MGIGQIAWKHVVDYGTFFDFDKDYIIELWQYISGLDKEYIAYQEKKVDK
jgi:hypothetical protein